MALAGSALGFGLGGFFDGILLHQVLQWHHLLSGLEGAALSLPAQILADGLFHLAMYLVTVTGLILLWRSRRCWAGPGGGMSVLAFALIGFGLWHLADAVLSHWLLGLHRIRMGVSYPLAWDLGWLVLFGFAPLAAGLVARCSTQDRKCLNSTPLAIAGLALAMGGLSAFPARDDAGIVTALFPAGASAENIMEAISKVDGEMMWVDDSQRVWSIRLHDKNSRYELYAGGALLVSSTYLPAGCFDWYGKGA